MSFTFALCASASSATPPSVLSREFTFAAMFVVPPCFEFVSDNVVSGRRSLRKPSHPTRAAHSLCCPPRGSQDRAPSRQQVEDQHDGCDDEKQVDETTTDVRKQPDQPQHEKNRKN